MKTNRNAFTLIELLVVIAIIGILAAMVFPAINKALQQAKISQARQEALSIASAIDLYWNDYSQLPVPLNLQGLPDEDGNNAPHFDDATAKSIIQVLIAEPQGTNLNHQLNPKRKVYLSMEAAKADGTFLDPWGTQYRIKLDRNYNMKIEYYNISPNMHRKRAIAVSAGPNRLWSGGSNEINAKDNVASVALERFTN
jgi:prepilin-type N-terminal cleavage/methylation domain-containing protein